MRYVLANGVSYYRLVLPTQLIADRFNQGGTWYALLTIGRPRLQRSEGNEQGVDSSIVRGLNAGPQAQPRARMATVMRTEQRRNFALGQRGGEAIPELAFIQEASATRRTLPYSLIVHAYSNVSLRAELRQDSYEPGGRVSVTATLTQSGLPLEGAGSVWGELIRPNGSMVALDFTPGDDGFYTVEFIATSTGVHRLRVRAHGETRKGMRFTREQTLTAVVWRGGDRDAAIRPSGDTKVRDEICAVLDCLLANGGAAGPDLERRLKTAGIDLDGVRACLKSRCSHGGPSSARNDG